ncbi:hypothetical protein [Sulfitobacter guttiformis]|uniref:Uncharacterized protein n=1 Tax=Sulfitobacter guttiformis TaxID=74349 RepID=A0A420DK00_9RHOB|nr:hypothetical protein [Sulfitobacter guttiformis]KIN71651.1 hypothetical protein Z949_814 [Sulfitobacter guttiformis KCTC 32187]RKE94518.1 hypothetical protein C8N30_3646 [Sulfitobacter guttiformis]
MIRYRLIDETKNDRLGKCARKLSSAHRATDAFLKALNTLEAIEALAVHNELVRPALDFVLITYVSAFNSSDQSQDGVTYFDARKVFSTQSRLAFHKMLVSYRNKEIAHLTNYSVKQSLILDTKRLEVVVTGTLERPIFANAFQPNSDAWKELYQHILIARTFSLAEIDNLQASIKKIFMALPPQAVYDLAIDRNCANLSTIAEKRGIKINEIDHSNKCEMKQYADFMGWLSKEHPYLF